MIISTHENILLAYLYYFYQVQQDAIAKSKHLFDNLLSTSTVQQVAFAD